MMRCPSCENTELRSEDTPQGVEIDRCPKCDGVWLDRSEIFHFSRDPKKFMGVLKLAMQFQVATEKASPQTGKPMLEIKLSPDMRLDFCADTRGIWFDSGEFPEFCKRQLGIDPLDTDAGASPLILGLEPLEGVATRQAPLELSLVPIDDGPTPDQLEADHALNLDPLDGGLGDDGAALTPTSRANVTPSHFDAGRNTGAPAEPGGMVCPKCGVSQAHAGECSACGIVIAKFLQRQIAEQAQESGLEHAMSEVIAYSIHQQKEWAEILVGWERSNKYNVSLLKERGSLLCEANEYSNSWVNTLSRQLLGSIRPFTMMIKDDKARPIARFTRPLKFYFHRLEVRDPGGTAIGSIERRFALLANKYTIKNPGGRTLLQLRARPILPWTFKIDKSGRQVGEIKKQWSGFLTESYSDADSFGVQFDKSLSSREKLLLLGAVFLIDFVHFENNVRSVFGGGP